MTRQNTIDWDTLTPLAIGHAAGEAAFEAAWPSWKWSALEALRLVCQRRETFIVDDVWEMLDKLQDVPACPERRAMAGVLSEGAKRGWCEKTAELRRSAQPQCHGNLRSEWRSLLR